jgi:hypothetical protein
MKRPLLSIATAVSLIAFIATATACVCGIWRSDSLWRQTVYVDSAGVMHPGGLVSVTAQAGGISMTRVRPVAPLEDERRARTTVQWHGGPSAPAGFPRTAWIWGGYFRDSWVSSTPQDSIAVRTLFVPYWPILGASAALPLRAAVGIVRRRRRVSPGCCARCGYDLRASPARCPECGAVPQVT